VILLDTHVVLWLLGEYERLSHPAKDAILQSRSEGSGLAISGQTLYEIARGMVRGRIKTSMPVETFLAKIESQFLILPVTRQNALLAAELPASFPGDPFDRIIAATALAENIPLVTADQGIRLSRAVKTIW
jgi:PIN domain nuclease of toxin-antitoxin system